MDELENGSDDSSTTPEKYSTTKTNYLVLSDAGKLIFSQYGDDTSLCTICGLIQTVRVTSLNDASLSFGDLQYIHTDSSMLVFMSVGSIILVAISFKDDDGFSDTVDYFRLKLECIYSAIIFTLTDEVQYMLLNDPQLDISYLLGSTTSKIRNLLDEMDLGDDSSTGRRSCCWLGGVDIISPIPAEIRNYTSKVLATECSKNNSIIYAILSTNKSLFNIIQPHRKEHQLSSFDLNLLLHIFESQTLVAGNELWFPICLPRLNQSGFVHCYQRYIGVETDGDMRLTLISQEPSIDEFQSLQLTAAKIRMELGIELEKDSVLRIYDLSDRSEEENSTDSSGTESLIWERSILEDINDSLIDFGNVSVDNGHEETDMNMWRKRFRKYWAYCMKRILDENVQNEIMQSYCDMSSLIHFVFRLDVPIRHCNSGLDSGGYLSQLFGPPLGSNWYNISEKRVWQIYQKLNLMLRQGSEQVEDTLSTFDDLHDTFAAGPETISQYRPSQVFHDDNKLHLTDDNFVSIIDGDEIYAGLRGPKYEFYAVLPGNLSSASDAKILCATLIETLLSKGDELQPLSFL